MCIFSQPVVTVGNTQIFARASSRGTQFLAYQMNYESSDTNAMILPLPVRQPVHSDSLRFIDLKNYTGFFSDLARGFPFTQPLSIGCSGSQARTTRQALTVFEVGSYVASFVPMIADFARLDERFRLPEAIWLQLPQYQNFGFAVFQLAAGSLKPHPMALEFECATGSLYFPTMHIHDGEIHEREEFDHVLYAQHASLDSQVYGYQNSDVSDRGTGLVRSKYVAKQFCDIQHTNGLVAPDLLVHRRSILGEHPNRDIELATTGDPIKPQLNLRPLLSYAPWLMVAAALTWFFARRRRIKNLGASGRS